MKSDLTWLRQTCWLNDARLAGPVRGVALIFTGLGCGYHGEYYTPFELDMAERGVLTVHVHYGPWSWMNREARRFVDRAVATVYAGFGLDDSVPLISFGGSMGCCATLLYA